MASRCALLLVLALSVAACIASQNDDLLSNQLEQDSRTLSSDSLLGDIMAQCMRGLNMDTMTCIRVRVLMFLDHIMGSGTARQPQYRLGDLVDPAVPDAIPRDTEKLDEMIASRVSRLLKSHAFRVQLPDTLFQSAILTLRPANLDLDVQFPPQPKSDSRAYDEARGILKKKLLLPVLLLLKLKMKALMPILVLISSIKALKALVLSKIAFLVVAGFVFLQLCKKLGGGGAMMPMPMPMPVEPPAPSTSYGAPAPAPAPMPYAAPAAPSGAYGPSETSWEPATAGSSNSYSRVWDSHQLAYKSYYSPESSTQTIVAQSASQK